MFLLASSFRFNINTVSECVLHYCEKWLVVVYTFGIYLTVLLSPLSRRYHHVLGLITRTLPQLLSLDLKDVSPQLHTARNLDLVVPGTCVHPPSLVVAVSMMQRCMGCTV